MRQRLFWVVIVAAAAAILTRDLRGIPTPFAAAAGLATVGQPSSMPFGGSNAARWATWQDDFKYQSNPHLVAGSVRAGQAIQESTFSPAGRPDPSTRLREGREVQDLQATFQIVGERVSCRLPSLKTVVVVLENLALERVHEMLTRYDETTTWEVEGVITENHGRNYLLLRRAVVNSVILEER